MKHRYLLALVPGVALFPSAGFSQQPYDESLPGYPYGAPEPGKTVTTPLGTILVDNAGRTLYVYDRDAKGATTSACTGTCIATWPPFLPTATEQALASHTLAGGLNRQAVGDWSFAKVVDSNGIRRNMWAYKGKPVYLYAKDLRAGDTGGNGVGGVWHVVTGK